MFTVNNTVDFICFLKRRSAFVFLLFSFICGCDDLYPEVVVINSLGGSIMVKDISAGGCLYEGVLTYNNATSPMRCLPGEYSITFKKIDVEKYCKTQTEYGNIEGLCLCDGGTPYADTDIVSKGPLWYNYKTMKSFIFKRGESYLIELKQDDIEQDFSVPGPYGH